MRTIRKSAECQELRSWKKSNAPSPQNIHYANVPGDVRACMLALLITEQHGLCAYTMKTIPTRNGKRMAHIEHILPQSAHAKDTVTWTNLLACVPGSQEACEYGARRKDNFDPALHAFPSPTTPGIADEFRFRRNGNVEGVSPRAKAAIVPKVLNLNHPHLVNDRRAKIEGALSHKPTAANARRRALQLRKPDDEGKLEAYCEALAQVLETYALQLEGRSGRIAGNRRHP